jgi:ABC-type transport system substrate-binding protein
MIIYDQLLGDAYQPDAFALFGLPYIGLKYYFDLSKAVYYLNQAYFGGKKLTDYGFALKICYTSGNTIRQAVCENLAYLINKIGQDYYSGVFHAIAMPVAWTDYIPDMDLHMLPTFFMGTLELNVDDFALEYCHSKGHVASAQRYHNPVMDELIEEAVNLIVGPSKQAIYYQVAQIFYDEVVAVPLAVPVGRVYMRDWVQGYYYNPIYPGVYAYTLWKWPMTDTVGAEGYFVGDVNFDGKVSMDDVVAIVDAFGSYAVKGGMPIMHPKWNFYCDVDDSPCYRWRDHKIDMGDIVNCLNNFGKTSIKWHP